MQEVSDSSSGVGNYELEIRTIEATVVRLIVTGTINFGVHATAYIGTVE